jgi:hypothetical protein
MSNIESFESRLKSVREDEGFMECFREGGMYDELTEEETEQEIIHEAFNRFPKATPETLTKEYLEKLIEEIKERADYDTSHASSLEKEAQACFNRNLSAKKYSVDDVAIIAELFVQLSEIKFCRYI